jgi:hypothetical protein
MERIITIKNEVGLFDSPTFYISENEDLKIYVKRADGKALKNYRMLVKHGNLSKTFTLFGEGTIELKAEYLNKNTENIEFELVLLDNVGVNTISGEIVEIEPLQMKKLQGKFEYSAMVQAILKWQEQHGKELNILKERFDEYEQNGINIDVVTEE